MVAYKTRWKHYVELWFDEPDPAEDDDADVVVRRRALKPDRRAQIEEFHSLQIDLLQSPESIHARFTRNTRAQIRRSTESDDLQFDFFDHPTAAQTDEFIAFYDAFALSKGLAPLSADYADAHRRSGHFSLTRVRRGDEDLVWHANVSSGSYIGLAYSASQLRSAEQEARRLIGRANRRLHWEELLRFRAQGHRCYDFGGWYEGRSDPERLSINRFKEEFGGKKVVLFASIENRTFVAKLSAALRSFVPRRSLVQPRSAGSSNGSSVEPRPKTSALSLPNSRTVVTTAKSRS